MLDLAKHRVVVTGGAGFLGRHLVELLRADGCAPVVVHQCDYDLTHEAAVARLYADHKPEVVFHLAAVVGGIGANRDQPGKFFYDNMTMGAHLIEHARRANVRKFVCVGTVCAYPKFARVPFREDQIWEGYPEETNAPYGLAKKMLLVQLEAYRQQYGLRSAYVLPTNLYGPGDNFDQHTSHVIPAIIRKVFDAIVHDRDEIVLWGDGTPTREFLYVEDCAQALVLAAQRLEEPVPINLGTGIETPISVIARTICDAAGFRGHIRWDTAYPNGQPRRCLDTTRQRERLDFVPQTALSDGIARTIEWFRKNPVSE